LTRPVSHVRATRRHRWMVLLSGKRVFTFEAMDLEQAVGIACRVIPEKHIHECLVVEDVRSAK
jgi:hypothetical protein